MTLKIYNSLTKTKEEFTPLRDKEVRLYSCGVTVYDQCHIGHARSMYAMEVIRRYLLYRGYQVRFARNITDVDDKIIKKANETGKTFEEVVKENIALYHRDLNLLGIPQADIEPRATENIDLMIAHIQGLIEKGFAYAKDGDVYFRVRQFKEYGKLSGQSVEKMLEAVRIEKDDKKEDPLDFALWKKSKAGEPAWTSPWGEGRPGWHIECSCMSMKHLRSQTLDIHAGGQDLIFPHHENEIAQSEALTGKPFARYWMHNGLLTINGQKMAKSLKNFITIVDLTKKQDVRDIKMFFLMTHYASPIDFSEEKMSEAHKAVARILRVIEEAKAQDKKSIPAPAHDSWLDDFRVKFEAAMDDDFNTPRALGVIFEAISEIYKCQDEQKRSRQLSSGADFIKKVFEDVFGIQNFGSSGEATQDAEVQELLEARQQARKNKEYKRSDELRDLLKQKNIIVEDTKDGQKWRKA